MDAERKAKCIEIWNEVSQLLDKVKEHKASATGAWGDREDHWDKVISHLAAANYQCSFPFNVDEFDD